MGITWHDRDTLPDDGDDSPTVTAFNGHAGSDLRDAMPFGTDPFAVEAMFVSILVKVAETGIDDELAVVFIRRWAAGTGDPSAVAAALSSASRRLRGVANADSLTTVDRWIDGLAVPRRRRFRPLRLGHA
jgi:hypothetical protein